MCNDADYWQDKYWDLFEFSSQQLGAAFARLCEARNLPVTEDNQ